MADTQISDIFAFFPTPNYLCSSREVVQPPAPAAAVSHTARQRRPHQDTHLSEPFPQPGQDPTRPGQTNQQNPGQKSIRLTHDGHQIKLRQSCPQNGQENNQAIQQT